MEIYRNVKRPFSKKILTAAGIFFIMIIVLLTTVCHIKKEPDKVWDIRGKMVKLAESLIGLPYKYGGEELYGFDCSGFVFYVYDCFGYTLPRTAKKQAKLKERISLRRAKPGDILAFKLKNGWHTAIYLDKHTFIHAPNRRDIIKKEILDSPWKKRLKRVIRIIKD